jgi:extracellular elastinolytic metalloproteinase
VSGADVGAYSASFGPALTTTGVSGAIALYNDGTGTATDACEASRASLTGKVALIDRGSCDFTVKVMNAQGAGAIGVIVANNTGGDTAFSMGGTERRVRIPAVMVSQNNGSALRLQLGATAQVHKSSVPPLKLDGDMDSDIVFHEYGHGLTWRMIGGMSGPLAGAIGEGASDTVAFLLNGDDRIGEYAYGTPAGIRRNPYAGYPRTYADVTGAEVHDDGEIYAAAMYRVLENYLAAGLTADTVLSDFVEGMNFTPATPAYENMRDGMLQATAGTGRECLIWRAFAQTGIGVGAVGAVSRRGAVTITASFTVPVTCR